MNIEEEKVEQENIIKERKVRSQKLLQRQQVDEQLNIDTQFIKEEKNLNCSIENSRHAIAQIIYLFIITPTIILPCLYILIIGPYCIFSLDTIIDTCDPFAQGHIVIYYLLMIVTHSVVFANLLCIVILGRFGLNSFLHRIIRIKKSEQINCLCTKKCDCRFISNYFIFLIPSLILQIETYWAVGDLEHMWYFATILFLSVITTSYSSLTILYIPMDDSKSLLEKGHIVMDDLNNPELIDRYNENFDDKLLYSNKGNNYFLCTTNKLRRYRWFMIYAFNLFVYSITFFVYDLMRITMKDTSFSNDKFYRLYIFFSTMAITFRIFYANFFWNKMNNQQSFYQSIDSSVMKMNKMNNKFI